MAISLDSLQIVMPQSQQYTDWYLASHRVCLFHIVNVETGKTYCGRDPDGWDWPMRDMANLHGRIEVEPNPDSFCLVCARHFSTDQ